ncbi:MAG: aspartate-semialdehyde dehydrogenase [Candidatus Altiarchaeota archaeon]|nr:aspartate-semialdehyde dehydrogenase [Candidatus Altiarchaeota archaeon]
MAKLKIAVLGATGMVGQRFIAGLQNHPYFELGVLAASERSVGKRYAEAAKWYIEGDIPKDVASMRVELIDKKVIRDYGIDLAFSAIPAEIAREVEGSFAQEIPVFSNTKTYRMDDDVPLMIPEINPGHFDLIKAQQKKRGWKGYIITNPNCTTVGFALPLKPIYDALGVDWVTLTSMQALSGAGYEGVPSMAIVDNIIPYIGGEEEKCELEPLKILGSISAGKVKNADFKVIASCNRVAVLDGHMISTVVGTKKDFTVEDVKEIFRKFKGEPQKMKLPTAPDPAIIVRDEDDRPQPRRDRNAGGGMAVTVGRIMKKQERVLRFTSLSHNTIRGAAGASILNAELAYKKKLL